MTVAVKSHYKTKDMGLVATLACTGIQPAEMQCIDDKKRRFLFFFERTDENMKIIDDYYAGNARVNPVDLMKNIRLVKAQMESYVGQPT